MIQIKNRITGLYDIKGHHGHQSWTDKMHKRGVWGTLGHAKTHISQCISLYWSFHEDDIRNYLNSDFLIINEDYSVTTEPVATYIIEKLKEYMDKYKNREYYTDKEDKFLLCEKLIEEFKTQQKEDFKEISRMSQKLHDIWDEFNK